MILHTEGQWRLVQEDTDLPEPYIEHKCSSAQGGIYKDIWTTFRCDYCMFNLPCGWCEQPVPEGLQGLYVMLTDCDMTT